MALTSDGEYLYAIIEPLFKTINKSIQLAQYNSSTPLRVLQIVEPSSYDYTEIFDILKTIVKAFEIKYPDVKVQELLCDFKEMRQTLEFGNADLVFTEDFVVRDIPNISIKRLSSFRLYIAVSGQNPLAASDELDLPALNKETLFTLPTLTDEQEDLETQLRACRLMGFTPKRVEFISNFPTLMHAIKQDKGICFCSKLKSPGFDIRYYPVNLPVAPSICVAWRTKKLSREVKNFLNMLPDDNIISQENDNEYQDETLLA